MRNPTIRQKKALNNLLGNGGNVTKAMLDANYSVATANTPQKLTESKGWKELIEEYLPDNKIIKKISEGLEAYKIQTSHTEPDRIIPDFNAQQKFVETSLKIKGRLVPEESDMDTNILIFNINSAPNDIIEDNEKESNHTGSHQPPTKTTNSPSDILQRKV